MHGLSHPLVAAHRSSGDDVLTLYGPEDLVENAARELGIEVPPQDHTDHILLGIGLLVGLFIGHLALHLGTLTLTLGLGGGALISGLIFGWLNMRRPTLAAIQRRW